MAVQEFGIPSGFEADLESISGHNEIKRTETEDRKVILYFDEVGTFNKGIVVSKHSIFISIYQYRLAYQETQSNHKFAQDISNP